MVEGTPLLRSIRAKTCIQGSESLRLRQQVCIHSPGLTIGLQSAHHAGVPRDGVSLFANPQPIPRWSSASGLAFSVGGFGGTGFQVGLVNLAKRSEFKPPLLEARRSADAASQPASLATCVSNPSGRAGRSSRSVEVRYGSACAL